MQISAVIVNNDDTRIKDHLSGRNYKYVPCKLLLDLGLPTRLP